jgi:hypothetical protein
MENYFRNFFENLNHTPKEFAIKHSKKSQNDKLINTFGVKLTFDTSFLSDIEPEQFHTNDIFTGEIVNIGGIVHYENRKYMPRFFIKGDGKSWLNGDDIYLFHKPFGNHKECYSAQYNSIQPNQYLIEYFPLVEVVGKIREIYFNDLDKSMSFHLAESFEFESMNFKYSVEFIPKTS